MTLVPASSGGGGGAGASTLLYSSVLSAPAASIDTGASGVAGTSNILEIIAVLITTQAAALSTVNLTFNNDSGTNYDRCYLDNANATVTGGSIAASANIPLRCHGNGGSTSYASPFHIVIPGYALTTYWKTATVNQSGQVDATAANNEVISQVIGWRNTAAISRVAFTAGSGNLATGSAVWIYGR